MLRGKRKKSLLSRNLVYARPVRPSRGILGRNRFCIVQCMHMAYSKKEECFIGSFLVSVHASLPIPSTPSLRLILNHNSHPLPSLSLDTPSPRPSKPPSQNSPPSTSPQTPPPPSPSAPHAPSP